MSLGSVGPRYGRRVNLSFDIELIIVNLIVHRFTALNT